MSEEFRALRRTVNVTPASHFIRTTEPRHRLAVQHLWTRLVTGGDIYRGRHEGWYCVSDECFYPETEVVNAPGTGENNAVPVKVVVLYQCIC